ncbi:MAG: peptidoglycan-binding protein, partial [Prevotella sp.]|nr:peptidoglycan-binding protein [Prevotella sp.]
MILFKRGSRGEDVKQIQIALHLYPDGIFGPQTEAAVKEFQREHKLKVDGI